MKTTFLLFALFFTAVVSLPALAAQPSLAGSPALAEPQAPSAQLGFLEQGAAEKTNPQEDKLYSTATTDINNGDYAKAISGFDQVAKMKGRRAEGALYWKAYALNKAGQPSD